MKIDRKTAFRLCLYSLLSVACTDRVMEDDCLGTRIPITLSGNIRQDNATRASDYGFVTGDRMGIYIVDYENDSPGTLAANGNRASNVLYTFNGDKYEWTAPLEIYWRDSRTPVDVYGYYPGVNAVSEPSAYRFEVSWQQNVLPQDGEISNYESSDLLWGKAENVLPTTDKIVINYHHQLAGVCVTLQQGDGMTDTEWNKIDKAVQVDNTVRTCTFNLQTAALTLTGSVDHSIQMLPQSSDRYRAVVIPQTVDAGKSLISITIDGKTYSHTLANPVKYMGGKMHNFTLTINKSTATGDYTVAFTDEGITDWVNDEASHNFTQNQYVVIDCPEQGKLKECITAAGYDYTKMQNLKVRGILTTEDFHFMRDEMKELKHLNLHDVRVKNAKLHVYGNVYYDDIIPERAFLDNKNIRSLILPSRLKRIGESAFREMQLMFSTLEIPKGVTYIGEYAFYNNDNNGMELILPYSLDSIGTFAFCSNYYNCELKMTDNLKYIGPYAFSGFRMHGVFHLSSNLKEINGWIFDSRRYRGSITGDIEIPQGVSTIGPYAFCEISFQNRTNLILHPGVKTIGAAAFRGIRFASLTLNDDLEELRSDNGNGAWEVDGCFYEASIPFPITLPSRLRIIGDGCFYGCKLQGELEIPKNCLNIQKNAFALNELTKVTLPPLIESLSENLLAGNELTSVNIPKYVANIESGALACGKLQTIVCLAETPPYLSGDPFTCSYCQVDKNKCVLEVPEKSVELYRNTDGWRQFKNITPHRELACDMSNITCMEKGTIREGFIRSESPWEVSECPSWVTVTPSSSNMKKTEVRITVNANSGESRDGRIVFRLKDHDYTTYTEVKQVAADVREDQTITLQTATTGIKAVPLFIVGEGYDADDIASGLYLNDMKEQMEHIFSIEPMKTYRSYFTVSTAVACSPESGTDGLRKFVSDNWWVSESDLVLDYARQYGAGIKGNEENSTILVLRNSNKTGDNITDIYYNSNRGLAVSWMAKSNETYPFNQQGFILREFVGTAFGKLGPEQVNHITFLQLCICPNCDMEEEYRKNRSYGWWQNVTSSNKLTELPWYHLIFDEKYAQIVDVYEGALNHSRGAYRSENASVMGNQYIPYFNTISREILVRRIMEASGGKFDFAAFKQNDKIEIPE
ncbi:MAG: leucine-rich repeat protein [Paraprevotella sp.]|nr:leucine-rich repeat protein [Paraprevotella sp.]